MKAWMRLSVIPGIAVGAIAAALTFASSASAGEYVVAQCHAANSAHEASTLEASRADYAMRDECRLAPDRALKVLPNSRAPSGHLGYWYWEAPPGTRIVGVEVDAKLRREDGHRARLYMADGDGRMTAVVASGESGPTDFDRKRWTAEAGGTGASRFYAALICENNGDNCAESTEAKTFVRNVELTLRDTAEPTVGVSTTSPTRGWTRGSVDVAMDIDDLGSGGESRDVVVNGVQPTPRLGFICNRIGTSDFVRTQQPCRTSNADAVSLDSSDRPFHDGNNRISVCARDFAVAGLPNVTCTSKSVSVDNMPPDVAFFDRQEAADPELIRVAAVDLTSGLLDGSALVEYRSLGGEDWKPLPTSTGEEELRARVDSESELAGTYEFRATVRDVAGNTSSTWTRQDGSPMRLDFPLKQKTELDAFFRGGQARQVVRYKKPSKVRGFLLRPDGTPVSGEQVVVHELFDDGSLVQRRIERVRTGADGGFVSKVPGGPSREITVSYEGSTRYMDDSAPELDFNVKSRAGLKVERKVRAGNAVRFRGRVGRYFARIPDGGKLVELQFKKRAKTWYTAKEALGTTSRGRITIPYRFRRYYTERVTFVFRLKVTRESSWPYRVPASSKPVQVTVVPRKR